MDVTVRSGRDGLDPDEVGNTCNHSPTGGSAHCASPGRRMDSTVWPNGYWRTVLRSLTTETLRPGPPIGVASCPCCGSEIAGREYRSGVPDVARGRVVICYFSAAQLRSLRSLRGAAGPPCHFRCPKPCNFQCPLTSQILCRHDGLRAGIILDGSDPRQGKGMYFSMNSVRWRGGSV